LETETEREGFRFARSQVRAFKAKTEFIKTKKLKPIKIPKIKSKVLLLSIRKRRETLTRKILPPRKPTTKITFGDPRKFGRSFNKATGATSFTLAVPIRRQDGKLFVRDFNFRFKNGKIVSVKKTGRAVISEKVFRAADKRRRDKNPGFTFGDTRTKKIIVLRSKRTVPKKKNKRTRKK
ncbi:hypothetical protein LCGC14_1454500, partial [marine sediment metagenome]